MWNKLFFLKSVPGKCLQTIKQNRCPYKLMEWEAFIKIKASAWIVEVAGFIVWLEGCMEAFTVVALITPRARVSISHFHIHAVMNLSHVGARSTAHLCPSSHWERAKWSHAVHLYACDSFSRRCGLYMKWKLYLKVKKENKKTDEIWFPKHISKVSYFGEDLKLGRKVKLVKRRSLNHAWGMGVSPPSTGSWTPHWS